MFGVPLEQVILIDPVGDAIPRRRDHLRLRQIDLTSGSLVRVGVRLRGGSCHSFVVSKSNYTSLPYTVNGVTTIVNNVTSIADHIDAIKTICNGSVETIGIGIGRCERGQERRQSRAPARC
jgi:hypothetical protein